MDFTQIKQELTHISRKTYEKGYTQSSGGNISCRVPGAEDLFAIKRTAINMGEMTEADVLIVTGDGKVIEGEGKPSKEINFHLGVMKLRPEVNAVVHCHPNYSIAFANCGLELPHTTVTSRKVVGRVPLIKSAPAGSELLRDYVIEAFRANPDCKAILMAEHGICSVGPSLQMAYNIADLIEQTAAQAYMMLQISQNKAFFETLKP